MLLDIILMTMLASPISLDEHNIVNGSISRHKPFFVMTLQQRDGINYRGPCGASLISPRFALTAAHCVSKFRAGDAISRITHVYVGAWKPWHVSEKNGGKPYQVIAVKNIYVHPDHDVDSMTSDLALIELKEPALSQFTPIDITDNDLANDDKLRVFGFGRTKEGGSTSKELLRVSVRHTFECGKASAKLDDTMFCAGGTGKGDSCSGDSGGPILHNKKQVGVVSWGYGCNRLGEPGVYAKIDLEWIDYYLQN